MALEFVVTRPELEQALADLDVLAGNGLPASEAVFFLAKAGRNLGQCRLEYDGVTLKAHPTDASLNWGRAGPGSCRHYRRVGDGVVSG